ncbi:hypothetical protein CCYA_CCYA13G3555 [Cyanidiococcus yangmingshanensis]|nr:hypothetical protein CCYA_CCYA13G3555 [Cyanidiococcus yangmingshanensis]
MEHIRSQVDTSLTRTIARSVIIGNTLTVVVLGILYANYRIFQAYVSSFILAVFVAEAFSESRDRLVEWFSGANSITSLYKMITVRKALRGSVKGARWTEQRLGSGRWPAWLLGSAALFLLALRVHNGFLIILAGAILITCVGLFVLAATRVLVRFRIVHARTAAAALLVAALIGFSVAALVIFITGILQDLVGAARALTNVAHSAARVKRIDPHGILAKGAEQLQMLLAPHVVAAERFALQFRDLAKELGVDMENRERWWVKGSDPSWWRRFLTPDSVFVEVSSDSFVFALPSWPHVRSTIWTTWQALRKNLSPGSVAKLVRWMRPHVQSEQILAGARLVMFMLVKLAQALGVVLAYSDGTAAFLGMLLFLLRQQNSVMQPLLHWIPFRDPGRNQRLERALHHDLHDFVWSTLERMWMRSLLVWCVFVAFALELEFLAALCTGISVVVPVLPGPLFWCALFGLPQLMMRPAVSNAWRWGGSVAFIALSLIGQKLMTRYGAHNNETMASEGKTETVLPQPGGLLTLSALLGWRIFGGFRGALIASCCIFLALLLLHCTVDGLESNDGMKTESEKKLKLTE